jgi:hypothetical protein
MVSLEACERRVFRLAILLTGDPVRAAGVIREVVGACPDLQGLDSAHLDRLTVLRCREAGAARRRRGLIRRRPSGPGAAPTGSGPPPADARAALAALAGLPDQPREAWVFCRLYELPPREAARAMDCSRTATERHLAQADEHLARRRGGASPAAVAETLRAYTLSLDVPEIHRDAQRLRRRLRIGRYLLLALLLAGAAAAVIVWWRLLVAVP